MTSEGAEPVDSDGVEPGTVRPGGRTARVREAVLRAAGDALVEHGFDGLDLADVARRAEVGKTTVYRRWSSPAGLVADLLTDMAEQSLPRTDAGSLAEDLRANARLVVRTLTDPRQGPLFRGRHRGRRLRSAHRRGPPPLLRGADRGVVGLRRSGGRAR
ncbi:transcriptional regulator, TetR family [Streptomyces sp. Ncost-T6T-2b]|nr:transcriptional regulator, TetR family [Streptomyces sp. Ncost-T6T-2b]